MLTEKRTAKENEKDRRTEKITDQKKKRKIVCEQVGKCKEEERQRKKKCS